jgi:hypothetical protein
VALFAPHGMNSCRFSRQPAVHQPFMATQTHYQRLGRHSKPKPRKRVRKQIDIPTFAYHVTCYLY